MTASVAAAAAGGCRCRRRGGRSRSRHRNRFGERLARQHVVGQLGFLLQQRDFVGHDVRGFVQFDVLGFLGGLFARDGLLHAALAGGQAVVGLQRDRRYVAQRLAALLEGRILRVLLLAFGFAHVVVERYRLLVVQLARGGQLIQQQLPGRIGLRARVVL